MISDNSLETLQELTESSFPGHEEIITQETPAYYWHVTQFVSLLCFLSAGVPYP